MCTQRRFVGAILFSLLVVVGAGVACSRGVEQTEAASATQPAATEPPAVLPTATEPPAVLPTPAPTEAVAQNDARSISESIYASFTDQEQAALQNHGRAATALFNQDGGLFFSLLDLNGDAWNDADETRRRARCFVDGIRDGLSAEAFAAPATMDNEAAYDVALPVYVECVPGQEIFDRAVGAFLWGHREYGQNQPPLTAEHSCITDTYPSIDEFVAAVVFGGSAAGLFRVACLGIEPHIVPAPAFVLPDSVNDSTPVGYGRVVGLTADRDALFTVDAAPGTELTCLESRQLQFYLQPLDGSSRVSAGDHRIVGESVSKFATNGRHAVWVEFCEFGENWFIADIVDDTLTNVRPVSALNGDAQFGNTQALRLDGDVATGWVYRGQFDGDIFDRVEIDLQTGALLTRTELGPGSDLQLPGVTALDASTRQRSARIADGREIPLPENHRGTFAHDPERDTLYISVNAAVPGNSLIVALGKDVATDFAPVGLNEGEQVLTTISDGRAWLIERRDNNCASTLVRRSVAGRDRRMETFESTISRLVFDDAADFWYGIGFCDGALVPTHYFGVVQTSTRGDIYALDVEHIRQLQVRTGALGNLDVTDRSYRVRWPWFDPEKSMTVSRSSQLTTSGMEPGEFILKPSGVPVLFALGDEWSATEGAGLGVDGSPDRPVMSLQHVTGLAVSVYNSFYNPVYRASGGSAIDFSLAAELSLSASEVYGFNGGAPIPAIASESFADSGERLVRTVEFSVGDAAVVVYGRIPPEVTDYAAANAALEALLSAMTFDDS